MISVYICIESAPCFVSPQGPFATSLDRPSRRLSNHGANVRRRRADQGPLAGELSDSSSSDSAGVQHHPGGVAH